MKDTACHVPPSGSKLKGSPLHNHAEASPHPYRIKETILTYKPLIIILIICCILAFGQNNLAIFPFQKIMHAFMGYFFIFLSLFKFFDLQGFVDGFSRYDLITKRFKFYGYLYPFFKFFLGFSFLLEFQLFWVNWITLLLMGISGLGVLRGFYQDKKYSVPVLELF